MTLQQAVGLAAAVFAAVTGVLVAGEASNAIPSWIILVFSAASAGFGAANVYLSGVGGMAKTLTLRGFKVVKPHG